MNANIYADSIVQTLREALLVLDVDLRVKTASPSFYRTFKIPDGHATGRLIYELGGGEWDIPGLRKLLEEILPNDGDFEEFYFEQDFRIVGRKTLVLNARRLHDGDDSTQLILLAIEDLTARRRAESELAHQRARLSVTLSSIGDAVIATDFSSHVTFLNPTAERLTGWSQQEALGQSLATVFHIVNEETRKLVESPVIKAIREGQIVGLANHTILITKDKTERYIDDSAAPIRDERGSIIGVVLVFRDIGDRRAAEKQLEISETRYRRLFEAAHDGILILDAQDGTVIDVNRFLIDLLRYPREHFLGKKLWELGMFHDIESSKLAAEELRSKRYVRYENLPLQDRDGRDVQVEFVSNVYHEDGQQVIQCNIRDIRERKELERQQVALLAQEHAARVEAQAAERANRSKDIFLATLSHEMRTPLNAILGWATILSGDDVTAEDVKEGVAVIARNAKAQAQLIDDVLDVSRIVSDKLRLEMKTCNLREWIAAAVDTVQQQAIAKGIKIQVDDDKTPMEIHCDAARLQQVVWNLLSNAIKFTPTGGSVTVSLARERSTARIQVTDTGQGIAPDFVPFVFDRFRQQDSGTRRRFGGLGLGLSIVKHLVEMHGGTVRAESEGEGHGSTFTVYLPIRAIRITEPPSDALRQAEIAFELKESSASVAGLRVLIVDDEEDSRRLLTKLLGDAGAIVTARGSAAEAVAELSRNKFDILISDLGMPDVDGFDLIKELRTAGYSAAKLPAVALSAFAHQDDQRRAILSGFQVHLAKPVDPPHLLAVIASLAGRAGSSTSIT